MAAYKASRESVILLVELLNKVIDSPFEYTDDKSLQAAVKSQLNLASYSDLERGIYGCSLNTLKKITSGIGEGFDGLEKLRVLAALAFSKRRPQKQKPGSRRTLQEDKAFLLKRISSQDADLQRLNLVISSLLNLSRELAQLDLVDRNAYYELEINRIRHMISERRK